jgi:hypothetical protein
VAAGRVRTGARAAGTSASAAAGKRLPRSPNHDAGGGGARRSARGAAQTRNTPWWLPQVGFGTKTCLLAA